MSGPLFPLGQVVMTPGAAAAFEASGDDPLAFLIRHACLDPGDLDAHDIRENQLSLEQGFRRGSAMTTDEVFAVIRQQNVNWSGRADLNCRPLAPQASALPG